MKRVACLSTLDSLENDTTTSRHVIDIFNSTRSHNIEHQITGSFVICDQYLLMIVEGESTHLGNIIFKTRQDRRLKDFSLVMNVEIDKPEFTSWGIKILRQNDEGQERIYEKLSNVFNRDLKVHNAKDQERLDTFLKPTSKLKSQTTSHQNAHYHQAKSNSVSKAEISSNGHSNEQFHQSMISLAAWPKPGKIKLCPELIKICARLVGRPHRYEDLLIEQVAISEASLVNHLTTLDSIGILKKHNIDDKPKLIGIKGGLSSKAKTSSTDRFSMVLKNFLAAAKR